jgi:hypothetical protein
MTNMVDAHPIATGTAEESRPVGVSPTTANLVKAELLKLRTTRMFYGNALAALAFVPVSLAVAILTAGKEGGSPALDTSEGLRQVLSAASSGTLIVLVLGILMMAGEFRHNTATSTFLVCPDRRRVVGAKLLASALVGAGLAVAASVVTLAIAIPWLAAKDVAVDLLSADVGLVLLGRPGRRPGVGDARGEHRRQLPARGRQVAPGRSARVPHQRHHPRGRPPADVGRSHRVRRLRAGVRRRRHPVRHAAGRHMSPCPAIRSSLRRREPVRCHPRRRGCGPRRPRPGGDP